MQSGFFSYFLFIVDKNGEKTLAVDAGRTHTPVQLLQAAGAEEEA